MTKDKREEKKEMLDMKLLEIKAAVLSFNIFLLSHNFKSTFMKKAKVIKVSFLLGLVLTLVGAMLKILHEKNAEPFLIVGVFASITYVILAIYEIIISTRIDRSEKTMWIIAFISMSGLAGLIYFIFGRKRIVSDRV